VDWKGHVMAIIRINKKWVAANYVDMNRHIGTSIYLVYPRGVDFYQNNGRLTHYNMMLSPKKENFKYHICGFGNSVFLTSSVLCELVFLTCFLVL
jgi:hypothetical protein